MTTIATDEYKFDSLLMSSPATLHQTIIRHTHTHTCMHEHALYKHAYMANTQQGEEYPYLSEESCFYSPKLQYGPL